MAKKSRGNRNPKPWLIPFRYKKKSEGWTGNKRGRPPGSFGLRRLFVDWMNAVCTGEGYEEAKRRVMEGLSR